MVHNILNVRVGMVLFLLSTLFMAGPGNQILAQPTMLNPSLEVRTVVSGLVTPNKIAFLGSDDMLVLEKNTGRVNRIVDGSFHSTVLDLGVNFAAERGLLGVALHPDFANSPFVYLFWTESTSGDDSNVPGNTLLLGNRVDKFIWDGSLLTFAQNLIRIRALQSDAGQNERGNNNGGALQFGLDGKLYVFIGDVGRRGWLQNLPCGPTETCPGATVPDDQFGGPEPDNAHFTGVILRLNDDGTTPSDNPFFAAGSSLGGEAGANIQKIFSYGHRNSFGMTFDPRSGDLWLAERGDDSFSEINRVLPGMNGGWVQIMGPVERISHYKEIETSTDYFGLQQIRWSPENIANTPEEALSRLFMLPGAHYGDPAFSWKFEVAPAGMGFAEGRGLGAKFAGDLFIGAAVDVLEGGYLFRLKLTGNRRKIAVDDPLLQDRVADNLDRWDITESESIIIGRDFGICTDIRTGLNGNLYVVSISHGAIYEISGKKNLAKDNDHTLHSFNLLQNYPNPFNPSTSISWQSPIDSWQTLKVYDVLGNEITTLVDAYQPAGKYEAEFDANGLPSGIYFYKLQAGDFIQTKKMVLMR